MDVRQGHARTASVDVPAAASGAQHRLASVLPLARARPGGAQGQARRDSRAAGHHQTSKDGSGDTQSQRVDAPSCVAARPRGAVYRATLFAANDEHSSFARWLMNDLTTAG